MNGPLAAIPPLSKDAEDLPEEANAPCEQTEFPYNLTVSHEGSPILH